MSDKADPDASKSMTEPSANVGEIELEEFDPDQNEIELERQCTDRTL